MKNVVPSILGAAALTLAFAAPIHLRAADHGDAPTLGPDQGCDLADVYAFLDPNDNDNVILIGTVRGFIAPQEAGNFALFDPTARFTFGIENTGDSKPDMFIDLQFSPRIKVGDDFIQSATVTLRGVVPKKFAGKAGKFIGGKINGADSALNVYQPTLAATPNPQDPFIFELSNDKNPATGIKFFAGEADDPFFFDIPGFNRFVAKVLDGDATAGTELNRARDSFAGYNVLGIALSVPSELLLDAKPKKNVIPPSTIGVNFVAARGNERTVKGVKVASGAFQQVDRMGVPGVNVAFIPYNRKNAYNGGTTVDDGKGAFLGDIAGTLIALGLSPGDATANPPTPPDNELVTLAQVAGLPPGLAPTKKPAEFGTGDFLRLETDKAVKPNDGIGDAGSNANGFPNGRRIADDVIDTVISLVTKGGITTGDNVDASDIAPQQVFPFLALPQQPRDTGVADDNTRN